MVFYNKIEIPYIQNMAKVSHILIYYLFNFSINLNTFLIYSYNNAPTYACGIRPVNTIMHEIGIMRNGKLWITRR